MSGFDKIQKIVRILIQLYLIGNYVYSLNCVHIYYVYRYEKTYKKMSVFKEYFLGFGYGRINIPHVTLAWNFFIWSGKSHGKMSC